MYFPSLDEFRANATRGQIIPVYRQLLGDHLTPVTAFEVLGRDEHAFLLESVVGGEKIGRYSFIATAPRWVYTAMHGNGALQGGGRPTQEFKTGDPLGDLGKYLLKPVRYARSPHLPAF